METERRREEALALLHHRPYPDPEFLRALETLRALSERGDVLASLHLGDLYAQVAALPERWSEAREAYGRAARGGHPAALDRLGDLHLLGRGAPRAARAALGFWLETARAGYPVGAMHLAFATEHGLGTDPDPAAAHALRLWALAYGFPYAAFRLALDWEAGRGTERRGDLAWASARLAAEARYPHARPLFERIDRELPTDLRPRAEAAWTALAGHVAAWERRLLDLERREPEALADGNRFCALLADAFAPTLRALALALPPLALPPPPRDPARAELDARAREALPPTEPLDPEGLVVRAEGFATLDECAHVMELVHHELRPSGELVTALGEESSHEHEKFDGRSAILDFTRADVVVHWLAARLEALLGVDARTVEPFSVLHYGPGAQYQAHLDALDERRLAEAEARGDRGGQRVFTFLVTLAAARAGGETDYPRLGVTAEGRTGAALWHRNAREDGSLDERLLHVGRPVRDGEKWLLRTAVRMRPLEG
jgi:hypothetical protein